MSPRPTSQRPTGRSSNPRPPDVPASLRLRGHRDGAVGLRGPAGPAPGHRPEGVRRDGRRARAPSTSCCPPTRGAIPDRNGVALASSVDGLMIVADPQMTRDDAPAIAKFLANRLDLDYFRPSTGCASGGGSRFAYVARRVPSTLANRVARRPRDARLQGPRHPPRPAARLPGPRRRGQPDRLPRRATKPLAGLERTFNKLLAGKDGEETYEVGGGNRIPLGDNTTVKPRNGTDLQLTIDRDVQWYAQRVLRSTVRRAGGESGVGRGDGHPHGRDARAGRLPDVRRQQTPLAAPKDDLGSPRAERRLRAGLGREGADRLRADRRRQGQPAHPHPGAAELPRPGDRADRATTGSTTAGCGPPWPASSRGPPTSARCSPPGSSRPSELHGYLTRFGLGQRTDIGVRGETAGLLADPALWTQQTRTPSRSARASRSTPSRWPRRSTPSPTAACASTPSLVQGQATTDDGSVVGTDTGTRRRVVSAAGRPQTTPMMELVTDPEDGVAPRRRDPGLPGRRQDRHRAAGRRSDGCYDGVFTVSFAGFAPADEPRFTVYVVVENPADGGGGGSVAGPVFRKIMSYVLRSTPSADRHAAVDAPHQVVTPTGSTTGRCAGARWRTTSRQRPGRPGREPRRHSLDWLARLATGAASAGSTSDRRRHRGLAELAAGPPRRPVRRAAGRRAPTARRTPPAPSRPAPSPC